MCMACTSPPAAATSPARRRTIVGVAEKIADDRDANARSYAAHRRRERRLPFGHDGIERARDLSDDAASRARRKLPHAVAADDDEANRIATRVRDRRESDRDVARALHFPQRARRERHGRRRIDDDHRGHDRAVLGEPDVRAIAASEQPPIDALRIVALPVDAILAELGADAAQARVMCAGERAGDRPQRRPLHAANRVEQRAAGLGARCRHRRLARWRSARGPCRRSRMLPPLDADSALRSRHVTNHRRDDPLGADAFGFGGEVRQHAMPQHRQRHAPMSFGRDRRAARRAARAPWRRDERLPRARTGAPAHVPLHEIRRRATPFAPSSGGRVARASDAA